MISCSSKKFAFAHAHGEHRLMYVQGRKTAAQVQRLEALHAKQQAVLRRKTEEAEAARKRLHVSLVACDNALCLLHLVWHTSLDLVALAIRQGDHV